MPGLKYAVLQRTTSGNVITSVSGAEITVLGYSITAAAATLLRFSDESGTFYSGQLWMGTGLPACYAGSRDTPAFVVDKNKSLAITLTAATTIGGHITYYTNE